MSGSLTFRLRHHIGTGVAERRIKLAFLDENTQVVKVRESGVKVFRRSGGSEKYF